MPLIPSLNIICLLCLPLPQLLFRGGELDGRFALLPKGTATAALAAAPTTATGALEYIDNAYRSSKKSNKKGKKGKKGKERNGGGGGGSEFKSDGSLSAAALAGDCRYLCHASDPRWSWRPVRAEPLDMSSSSSRRRRASAAGSVPRFTGLWQRTPTLARRVAVSSASHAAHLSAQPLLPPPIPPIPLQEQASSYEDLGKEAAVDGGSFAPDGSFSSSPSSSSSSSSLAVPTAAAAPSGAVAFDRHKKRPTPPPPTQHDPRNVFKLEALAEANERRRARKAAMKQRARALRWLGQWDETRRVATATLHPSSLGYPTFQRFDAFFPRPSQHDNREADEENGIVERKEGVETSRDQGEHRESRNTRIKILTSNPANPSHHPTVAPGSRRSRSQATSTSRSGSSKAHLPPLRVAVLRLVSFSLRERGGVAEPSADLRLDVRHFKHPSSALTHPTGCGPGQKKVQALEAIAVHAQREVGSRAENGDGGGASATAAAVQAVAAQAAGIDSGDGAGNSSSSSSSSAANGQRSPSPKRSRLQSMGSIDWGSDEDPFPEDTTAPVAGAQEGKETTASNETGEDKDEGLEDTVEGTPLQQSTSTAANLTARTTTARAATATRVLPWWWCSLTGLDPQVQAAVAAEDSKLGEVQRLVDATLFRLAMQHQRPEALAHAAALAAAATSTTSSSSGGKKNSRSVSSPPAPSVPTMVRPTRSAATSSVVKQHGYSDARDIKGDRYASAPAASASSASSPSRRGHHDYSKSTVHITGGSSSRDGGGNSSRDGLTVTVSFACYEGRLRAVAVAELIAQHVRAREEAQRAAASTCKSSSSSSGAVLSVDQVEVCHWELLSGDDDGLDGETLALVPPPANLLQSAASPPSQPAPHKRSSPASEKSSQQQLLSSSERHSAHRIGRRRRSSSSGGSSSRGRGSDEEGDVNNTREMADEDANGNEGDLDGHSLQRPRLSSTGTTTSRISIKPNAIASSHAVTAPSEHSSLPPSSASSAATAAVTAAAATAPTLAASWVQRGASEDLHGVAEGALWLSWSEAWAALRRRGWVRHIGTGIDLANYYLAPGCPKPKRDGSGFAGVVLPAASPNNHCSSSNSSSSSSNDSSLPRDRTQPLRGRDYFTRPEAVIAHAQRVLRAEE